MRELTKGTKAFKETISMLRSGGRGKQLTVICAITFLYTGIQMTFPVLLPELRRAYGLDLTTAGLLLTVLWLVKAISQLPGGILADDYGEGNVMILSALLGSVSLILIIVSRDIIALFIATGIFGIGIAVQAMGRYTALASIYPDHIGTATGTSLAAGDAGQSLLPPLAGIITVLSSWHFGLGFTIPFLVLVAIFIWMYLPQQTSSPTDPINILSPENSRYVLSSLMERSLAIGTAILTIYLVLWAAFSSFYPTYLIEYKGLSAPVAGILFGLFFGLGIIIKPLSGAAFDRVNVGGAFIVIGGVSGLGLIALPIVEGVPAILLVTVLVAPVLGSGTISMSLLLEGLPQDIQGTGFGLIRSVTLSFAALSPVLFGFIADIGFFDEGFVVLGVLAWCMIPLAVMISRGDTS